ncbi:right-handed parallel beta-helix repeat-containing protein [Alkalihalobacillus sp. CinArs1]|uniref:right-handed parallel beta-helix repeat-containing protein n=1 Tax=Alkalihalobacillus sp. CinArs1 TaxID=2995314 RepID=UPI0022DD01C2|nr:right-handed parallel beta-helix repeat-containing protein [Alkalihalobacillus sp. CinArs1]
MVVKWLVSLFLVFVVVFILILPKEYDIQASIDQKHREGGGAVELPPRTIYLEDTIVLRSGVHLKGAENGQTILKIKAKIHGEPNRAKLLEAEEGAVDVKVSNITFDGDKQNRESLIDDPSAHTISFPFVKNFEIYNTTIINSAGASIVLYNAEDGLVENNTIIDSGSNGILGLQAMKNIVVKGNTVKQVDYQNGIYFSYQEGKSSENIIIEGNTVENAGDFGIEVGHNVKEGDTPHRQIVIARNTVLHSQNAGIAFRTVSQGRIEHNTIEGYGKTGGYGGDGIFVEGGFNKAYDVSVTDNFVKQTYESGNANGIYITGIDGALIERNTVLNSNGKGIFVQASNLGEATADFKDGLREYERITIRKNEIFESKNEGIHLQGAGSENNEIVDNHVKRNRSTGIFVANIYRSSGLEIEDNTVTDNEANGIEVYNQDDLRLDENTVESGGKAAIKVVSTRYGQITNNTLRIADVDGAYEPIIIESSEDIETQNNIESY